MEQRQDGSGVHEVIVELGGDLKALSGISLCCGLIHHLIHPLPVVLGLSVVNGAGRSGGVESLTEVIVVAGAGAAGYLEVKVFVRVTLKSNRLVVPFEFAVNAYCCELSLDNGSAGLEVRAGEAKELANVNAVFIAGFLEQFLSLFGVVLILEASGSAYVPIGVLEVIGNAADAVECCVVKFFMLIA